MSASDRQKVLQKIDESRDQAIGFLQDYLVARLPEAPSAARTVTAAIGFLARSNGRLPIAALAPELGTTSRTLERLFRREVGFVAQGLRPGAPIP